MISLDTLRQKKNEIISIAAQHGASDLRIYGSVARGKTDPDDVDFLVKMKKDASLFDLLALEENLEKQLGHIVHVAMEDALLPRTYDNIMQSAVPL